MGISQHTEEENAKKEHPVKQDYGSIRYFCECIVYVRNTFPNGPKGIISCARCAFILFYITKMKFLFKLHRFFSSLLSIVEVFLFINFSFCLMQNSRWINFVFLFTLEASNQSTKTLTKESRRRTNEISNPFRLSKISQMAERWGKMKNEKIWWNDCVREILEYNNVSVFVMNRVRHCMYTQKTGWMCWLLNGSQLT